MAAAWYASDNCLAGRCRPSANDQAVPPAAGSSTPAGQRDVRTPVGFIGPDSTKGKPVADHRNERHEAAYLRTSEVADLLHVSPKTVSRWAKEGKLPFLKTLGGHRRYPEADIRQLADELREAPNGI